MFYYRFRSSSELAIKELMYDEIYFASTNECNDPFEGKAFLSFEADRDKWKRLLECAWKNYADTNRQIWEEQLSTYLTAISPITYDVALKLDYTKILLSLDSPPNPIISYILGKQIIDFLNLYKPRDEYFVSFSRRCDDILMWSHYASMHQGYCLIFKAIDNSLYQCPKRKRRSISRDTPNSFSPTMSYGIPDSFPFHDILYSLDSKPNNAFYYFPEHVWGQKLDEHEKNDLLTWKSQRFLEKHNCWSYENESRLTLPTPDAWLFGESIEYSQQERLFYYQPTQLVGIILGARMDNKKKLRVREIIKSRMDRITPNPGDNNAIFNFVLFQSTLPDNQREVVINAEEIFTLSNTISKSNSDFDRLLQSWKEGWAIVFNDSSASRKQFL